jgi:hypothetical protein
MKTLYDLLEALPDDDAEGLRTAFRKAVKGAHPDINPGDPDAALKFRKIVRANEILSDQEQRAAYDHLLDLARLEQKSASTHAVAAAIDRLASGVMVLAGASIITMGGYLLFVHMSAASVAPPNEVETARGSARIAAVASAAPRDANTQSESPARHENAGAPDDAEAPGAVTARATIDSAPAADLGALAGNAASAATSYRARGIAAYRIFHRLHKLERAFADIAPARPVEKPSRTGSAPTIGRTHPAGSRATPVFPRRRAGEDPSREAFVRADDAPLLSAGHQDSWR